MEVIGFATQFYTLWECNERTEYRQDAYGNYHPIHTYATYTFVKNISKDIDKVKEMYPNAPIDMELRGASTVYRDAPIELPAEYFWFGKYNGSRIDEIMDKDFDYCMWVVDNGRGKAVDYIKAHPKYAAHMAAIDKERVDLLNGAELVKVGDVIEVECESNGYNSYYSDNGKYTYLQSAIEGVWIDIDHGGFTSKTSSSEMPADTCLVRGHRNGISLVMAGFQYKQVNGLYPYMMPIVGGKPQKTRGKTITVTVTEIINTNINNGEVSQFIEVKA